MELKVTYTACDKATGYELFEDELYMWVKKVEAFEVCQNCFVYERQNSSEIVQSVLIRAEKKVRSAISTERELQANQYDLKIELKPDESNLFTKAFIKAFFKWLLTEAYEIRATIYNDAGLSDFFYSAINAFAKYYDGDLTLDARKIQNKIVHG